VTGPLGSTSETFGIRTVTSYLTGSNAIEPGGARAFKINGVPTVIRGGGYDPNLFLHYSAADTAKQIALMKNMGVNTIRLEGHIMPADWFQQMDAAGILVNAGFQCCDAWELQTLNSSHTTGMVVTLLLGLPGYPNRSARLTSTGCHDHRCQRQRYL
jgi:exo-1,4-beta-D-glucosaminidase